MQLTYRNAQYQLHNKGQETILTGETGIYRGAKVLFRAPSNIPTHTGFHVLTYRNAKYRSLRYDSSAQAVPTEAANNQQTFNHIPALLVQ